MRLHQVLIVSAVILSSSFAQEEDSYLEAYQESHSPHSSFSYDSGTSYKMPSEEDMQPGSLLPQFLGIASVIAKILLKLTLFKVIVKFVAIVCLFLFIPTLKFHESARNQDGESPTSLDQLSHMIHEAFDKYTAEAPHKNP